MCVCPCKKWLLSCTMLKMRYYAVNLFFTPAPNTCRSSVSFLGACLGKRMHSLCLWGHGQVPQARSEGAREMHQAASTKTIWVRPNGISYLNAAEIQRKCYGDAASFIPEIPNAPLPMWSLKFAVRPLEKQNGGMQWIRHVQQLLSKYVEFSFPNWKIIRKDKVGHEEAQSAR